MIAALKHDDDDEPHADPAEEPMSEAAFAVIQQAHQLCDHPPARELTAEPDEPTLTRIAIRILSSQIRAGQLVRAMEERGDFDLDVGKTCLLDDETDDLGTDWAEVARAVWDSEGWKDAAEDYHRTRRGVRQ
jgi:hypothetical protein